MKVPPLVEQKGGGSEGVSSSGLGTVGFRTRLGEENVVDIGLGVLGKAYHTFAANQALLVGCVGSGSIGMPEGNILTTLQGILVDLRQLQEKIKTLINWELLNNERNTGQEEKIMALGLIKQAWDSRQWVETLDPSP